MGLPNRLLVLDLRAPLVYEPAASGSTDAAATRTATRPTGEAAAPDGAAAAPGFSAPSRLQDDAGFFPEGPRREGEEELHVFGDSLISMSPDGPRCRRPLPWPRASYCSGVAGGKVGFPKGEASPGGSTGEASPGDSTSAGVRPPNTTNATNPTNRARPPLTLGAGLWLFSQWRPVDRRELADGIEWFAREGWWEGRELEGEYFLRLVREDSRVAFQLLRRLAPGEKLADT